MSAEILPGCPLDAERGEVEQCASACAPPKCARIIPQRGAKPAETLRRAASLMRERAEIASWHPAVALAVADWLDATHANLSTYNATTANSRHAFAVARAFLGESS